MEPRQSVLLGLVALLGALLAEFIHRRTRRHVEEQAQEEEADAEEVAAHRRHSFFSAAPPSILLCVRHLSACFLMSSILLPSTRLWAIWCSTPGSGVGRSGCFA